MTPAEIAALHLRAMDGSRPWTETEMADLLQAEGVVVIGDPAGFALGRVTLDEAELLTIAVDPARRREGIGARLLSRFESAVREWGAAVAFLEVAEDNIAARRLYLGTGWRETGRRKGYYTRPGAAAVDALLLRKRLD